MSWGTLFFLKMHKKGQKGSKTGQKWPFLPVSDCFSKSYRSISTISGGYIPNTSFICNIERIDPKNAQIWSKKTKNGFFRKKNTFNQKFNREKVKMFSGNLCHTSSYIYCPLESLRKLGENIVKRVKKGQK